MTCHYPDLGSDKTRKKQVKVAWFKKEVLKIFSSYTSFAFQNVWGPKKRRGEDRGPPSTRETVTMLGYNNLHNKIHCSENFIRGVINAANIKKEKLHNKFIKFLVDVSCNHWRKCRLLCWCILYICHEESKILCACCASSVLPLFRFRTEGSFTLFNKSK